MLTFYCRETGLLQGLAQIFGYLQDCLGELLTKEKLELLHHGLNINDAGSDVWVEASW